MPNTPLVTTLAPVVWACLILTATSIPGSPDAQPFLFPQSDKVFHAVVYAVLGLLTVRSVLARTRLLPVLAVTAAVIAGTAFGVVDELHQLFIPWRTCSAVDLAADAAGLAAGSSLAAVFVRLRPHS